MTDHAGNTARSAEAPTGAEQAARESEAPINDGSDGKEAPANSDAGLDPDAPGVSVLGLQEGQPVENNEPA